MRERFHELVPGAFFLDVAQPGALTDLLRDRGWIDRVDSVTALASAGEGNMNLTLRATLASGRTLIVKQCRPWVEKYPQFDAPSERALVEARFYKVTHRDSELSGYMARLLGASADDRILVLQDLGAAADMSDLYRSDFLYNWGEVEDLLDWLGHLHRLDLGDEPLLANRGMRALNHAHIFKIPLDPDNGLDLDAIRPGLGALAAKLQSNAAYVKRVHELGEIYLADGSSLQHGDFYPGSFLRTDAGIRVIDPEFCFLGRPEFDVGVFVAHWLLTCHPPSEVPDVLSKYRAPAGFDAGLARQFAGVEVMRRILGVAQLPIETELEHLRELLVLSQEYVLG